MYTREKKIKALKVKNVICIVIGLIPVAVNRFKNIRYISVADACANYLARCKRQLFLFTGYLQ